MRIKRNYIPLLLAAAGAGASTGAAPTSSIVGRSGSAVPAAPRVAGLPIYTHTEGLIGSAILVALFLVVLTALAVGWWRPR